MKILLRAVLVVVLLGLLAAAGAWLFVDRLIAAAIEKGGTYATGVETDVGSVDASLLSGKLDLEALALANPPGFRDEPFVRLGEVRATWQNGTILSDTLEMDTLVVQGVEVNLEKSGSGTNYGKILENLEKLSSKKPEEPGKKGRVLVIQTIEILDVNAGLHFTGGLPLPPGSMSVTVPKIVIEDFRTDGETHEIVAKLTHVLVKAILESVLSAGKDIFPADIVKDLGQGLGGLKDVVEGTAKEVLKGLEGALKDAGGLFKPK